MPDPLPRVLLLYNQPVLPPGHPAWASEADIVETVAEIEKVLPPDRYVAERFAYARDPNLLLRKLAEWRPDVVVNLFEGEADRTETEVYNAAILEWTGVPFTGSGSFAQALGRDKIRTKYLLHGGGVPTAPFAVIDRLPAATWPHAWPAIVKPACQDASVGIDQESVVSNQAELERRAAYVFEQFGGPVLVEQFLFGREIQFHLFEEAATGGPTLMPGAELIHDIRPGQKRWAIYSYRAKWDEDSDEYLNTRFGCGVQLPSPLGDRVHQMCEAAYRLVGLRDYGRVDIRLTDAGEPYVIEVNPNPHLNSLLLVENLKAMGREFGGFVHMLVGNALRRGVNRG